MARGFREGLPEVAKFELASRGGQSRHREQRVPRGGKESVGRGGKGPVMLELDTGDGAT